MKNVAIRNTSPSLGRLFRERGRYIHVSAPIIPPRDVTDKNGVTHHLSAMVGRGTTYRRT